MIELFSAILIIGFVIFAKHETLRKAKSYEKQVVKSNDYTFFHEISHEKWIQFENIHYNP